MNDKNTKNTVGNNDITDIDKVLSRGDGFRKIGLTQVKQLQTVKSQSLAREKLRLSEKLGADHPRVKAIAARLEFNKNRAVVLKSELTKLEITIDDVDQDTAMVHGLVLDKQRQPLEGFTVALADQKGKLIQALGCSTTNEQGYFSIKVKLDKEQEEPVYILVKDKAQQVVHLDQAGIVLTAGRMYYREIQLKKIEVSTPCECDCDDVVFDPDVWKVWGRVQNQKQKPIENLTISLYDKDLIFDDRLGTAHTDDKGEFEILYRTDDFRDLIESRPDLYLDVIDRSGRVLHTTKKAVRFNSKRAEYYDIILGVNEQETTNQDNQPRQG